MSGLEIERKFLVERGRAYKKEAYAVSHIQQGYIPAKGATVRIRVRDDEAYLTIKGHPIDEGVSRYEFETKITMEEARELLRLCSGCLIDKHRYLVKAGRHTFEVDEFHGDNEGLVVAEVELSSADEEFVKPAFIGPEVTLDRHFRNRSMVDHPFSEWRELVPEEYQL